MKKIVFFLILLSVMIVFGAISACNQKNNEVKSAQPKEVDGSKIYSTYCVSCHGKDGKLGVSGALDLSITQLTLKERIIVISIGRGGMMPYKDLLSKEEIKAVAGFIDELKK